MPDAIDQAVAPVADEIVENATTPEETTPETPEARDDSAGAARDDAETLTEVSDDDAPTPEKAAETQAPEPTKVSPKFEPQPVQEAPLSAERQRIESELAAIRQRRKDGSYDPIEDGDKYTALLDERQTLIDTESREVRDFVRQQQHERQAQQVFSGLAQQHGIKAETLKTEWEATVKKLQPRYGKNPEAWNAAAEIAFESRIEQLKASSPTPATNNPAKPAVSAPVTPGGARVTGPGGGVKAPTGKPETAADKVKRMLGDVSEWKF